MGAKYVKTVLMVDKIDKATNMLNTQFDQQYTIDDRKGSAYLSSQYGVLEFLQPKKAPAQPLPSQLGALCLAVADVDDTAAKLVAGGFKKKGEKEVRGWFKKAFFPDFHGVPIIITTFYGPEPKVSAEELKVMTSDEWIYE